MIRRLLATSCLGLAISCAACDPTSTTLTVRVQTGFRAGHDFTAVQTDVLPGSVRCERPSSPGEGARPAFPTQQRDFVVGAFEGARRGGLAPGVYTARVTLFTSAGSPIAHRCVVTSLINDRVIRVALTVDCLGVTCPAPAGSPEFDQCLNGRCVTDECDLDDPSTREQCCDRAVLGALCDADETICETDGDCEPTLMCSGAPGCEEGACIEPVEDVCADGQYCDALANECIEVGEGAPDAGPRDGGIDASSIDASSFDASSFDAPTMADPDANAEDAPGFAVDAWATDTGADAWSPDAWALDVWAPDAGLPDAGGPDAWRPDTGSPDAWAPDAGGPDAAIHGGAEGSCNDARDGDADGAVDCEDLDCSSTAACTGVSCMVPLILMDPADEGLPTGATHWWRSDLSLGVAAVGRFVCGWGDLRGTTLVLRPSSAARGGERVTIAGGHTAIRLRAGQVLTAADPSAPSAGAARTIVVVAQQTGAGRTRAFVTTSTAMAWVGTGIGHSATTYTYENCGVVATASGALAAGLASEYLALPVGHDASTAVLRIDDVVRALLDEGMSPTIVTPNRHWIGAHDSAGTLDVVEVLYYPRVLSTGDRALVVGYLLARYGIGA